MSDSMAVDAKKKMEARPGCLSTRVQKLVTPYRS